VATSPVPCVRALLLPLFVVSDAWRHTLPVQPKEQLYADALILHVKDHDLGPEPVQRMIYRLLLRGYADGARVALGHHAVELYDHPRTRPATRYPWTVLCLPPGRVPSGRIAWTRQSGTD